MTNEQWRSLAQKQTRLGTLSASRPPPPAGVAARRIGTYVGVTPPSDLDDREAQAEAQASGP